MRRTAAVFLAAFAACALRADPEPGSKPERWEYGEVHFTARTVAKGGANPLFNPGGGPGGGGKGGDRGRGGAGGGMAAEAKATARWVTAAGEVEAGGWADLAEKLKAPAGKADSAAAQRVRLLNHLGKDGWELVSSGAASATSAATVMTFKRRVR